MTSDCNMSFVIAVVEFDIQAGDAAAATTSQTVEIPNSSDGDVQQSDPEQRPSGSTPAPPEDEEEVRRSTASPRSSTNSSNTSLDSWAEFEAEHFENFHEGAFPSASEVEDEED